MLLMSVYSIQFFLLLLSDSFSFVFFNHFNDCFTGTYVSI